MMKTSGTHTFVMGAVLAMVGCGHASSATEAPSRQASAAANPPPPSAGSSPEADEPNGPGRIYHREHDQLFIDGHALRDRRPGRAAPRPPNLLRVEIQRVERELAESADGDAGAPALIRQLAELSAELHASHQRDRTRTMERLSRAKSRNDSPKIKKARAQAEDEARAADRARIAATEHYERLVRDYPTWCAAPDAPKGERGCLDEVLHYLGLAHEAGLTIPNLEAREAYESVIRDWPSSRLVPFAHVGLAEVARDHAIGRAAHDEWSTAEEHYRKAIDLAPEDTVLGGYAAIRLAEILAKNGKRDEALQVANEALDLAKKRPKLPLATTIEQHAQKLLEKLNGA